MTASRENDDIRMAPIVLGVLGFIFFLGVAAQVIAKYAVHNNPASPAAVAPAASPEVEAPPAPEAKAPAAAPAPVAEAPSAPAAAVAPADPAPAPAPEQPAQTTSPSLTKLALAGGTEIEAAATGVENQLLAFINDASAEIDKGKWFDFDRLNFETGSARLTADSKAQVDNIAAILRAFPSVNIKIGGYTDNTGNAAKNIELSDARAKAVVDALVATGIAGDRLEHEGYGDRHPIADNATADGRAKNRRIAVSVRAK